MPRLAANLTMMFNEVPFPERFEAAARAGFTAVEYLFPYDHPARDVAGWQRAAGVETVLINLPPGRWAEGERGLTSLPGREAEFRASVATALAYADALGVPRLHTMAGILPAGADGARHRGVFVENLRYAARELAASGRTLLIEPISQRTMPGYFLSTQADAHALRRDAGAENLKVQVDVFHVQVTEGDLTGVFRTHHDAVGHVQIAGVPDRHEPDEGEVNYAYVLDLLDAIGYDGWVGCEYRPRGRTEDGLGWMKTLETREAR
jgi:hydroxypyruvate isomerase